MNYRFYLRTSRPNKKGLCSLYFIIEQQQPLWIPSGLFLPDNYWNQEAQQTTQIADVASRRKFTELQYNAEKYFQALDFENRQFSKRDFISSVINDDFDGTRNPLFTELLKEYIDVKKVSFERAAHYLTVSSEIKELYKGLRIKQISYEWGSKLYRGYREYLAENTATTKLKMIKAVVHYAMDLGLLNEDPLKAIKLKSYDGKKVFLSIDELNTLQKIYDDRTLPPHQVNVLRHFLFSCYTGLRRSDIRNFSKHKIYNDCLYLTTQKTKEHIIIPLSKQAKELLQQPFQPYTGEYLNRELSKIAKSAEIYKPITMHVGRHTFATISLRLGMELKTLSKILGHRSVKQTENYLHLVEDHLQEQMNVWNNLKVVHRQEAV